MAPFVLILVLMTETPRPAMLQVPFATEAACEATLKDMKESRGLIDAHGNRLVYAKCRATGA